MRPRAGLLSISANALIIFLRFIPGSAGLHSAVLSRGNAVRQYVCLTACMVLCALAVGCVSPTKVDVQGKSAALMTAQNGVPVLKVTAGYEREGWAGRPGWGGVPESSPAPEFARLASAAAERSGALTVPDPRDVKERLQEAGLEFTLEPDDETLQEYVSALEPPCYLVADIEQWQDNYYMIFVQKATVAYTISCYRPGEDEPVWTARVEGSERYVSARALVLRTLKDIFDEVGTEEAGAGQ